MTTCKRQYTIKVTEGNAWRLLLRLKSQTYVSSKPVDVDIEARHLENISIEVGGKQWTDYSVEDEGVLLNIPATMPRGVYSVKLTATYFDVDICAAYFECFAIVPWSYQSTAGNYIPESPVATEAAYIYVGAIDDAELEALKAAWRLKIAAAEAAKAAAEAAREDFDTKAETLTGTIGSQQDTIGSQQDTIASQQRTIAEQGSVVQQLSQPIGGMLTEINTGKQEIVNALTGKGVHSSTSKSLSQIADDVDSINQNTVIDVTVNPYENPVVTDLFSGLLINEEMARSFEGRFEGYNGYYVIEFAGPTTSTYSLTLRDADAYWTSDGHFYVQSDYGNSNVVHNWDIYSLTDGRCFVVYLFADEDWDCNIQNYNTANEQHSLVIGGRPKSITIVNCQFGMGIFNLNKIDRCELDLRFDNNMLNMYIYIIATEIYMKNQITGTIYNLAFPETETLNGVSSYAGIGNYSDYNYFRYIQKYLLLPKLKYCTVSLGYGNGQKTTQLYLPELLEMQGALGYQDNNLRYMLTSFVAPKLQKMAAAAGNVGNGVEAIFLDYTFVVTPVLDSLEELSMEIVGGNGQFNRAYFSLYAKEINVPKLKKVHAVSNAEYVSLSRSTILESINLPMLEEIDHNFQVYGLNEDIVLPALQTAFCGARFAESNTVLRNIYAPQCTTFTSNAAEVIYNCTSMRRLVLGKLIRRSDFSNQMTNAKLFNSNMSGKTGSDDVIHVELGQGAWENTGTGSMIRAYFKYWKPTLAVSNSDSSLVQYELDYLEEYYPQMYATVETEIGKTISQMTNLDIFLYNFQHFLAERLADVSGTNNIDFSNHVYNVLTQNIKDIIVNKGWTITAYNV